MRPLEIVLLVAAAVALAALVIGPRTRLHWIRDLALVIIPAGLLQPVVEGPRWQLTGLYLLALVLAGAWVLGTVRSGRGRRARGLARTVPARGTGVIIGVVGAVCLLIAAAPPVLVPVFRLPRPTGPYGIGTVTYHWVDAAREEVFTAAPDDRRELIAQLWYPAVPDRSARPVRYLDHAAAVRPLARMFRLPGFAFGHLTQVATHAVAGAPVAAAAPSYPVLIFVHGRGGYRQHNTRQVEEFVSRGYAVLTVDLPYAASGVVFPDGRLAELDPRMTDRAFLDGTIPHLARDVSFAVDRLTAVNADDPAGRLTGRLDLDRVGLFGLSLGGSVTAEACRTDTRIRACLPIDAIMPRSVVGDGLTQPTLWLTRDAATMRREGWPEPDVRETLGSIRAVFDAHGRDRYLVQVPGMYHLDFSDAPLISPLGRVVGLTGPIDQRRGREIADVVTIAFFDRYVRDRDGVDLTTLSERYPEVVVEGSG